jgi:hypothetical protein
MGYDATDTECIADLVDHSVLPVEFDLPAAAPKAFLPGALIAAVPRAQAQAKAIKAKKVAARDACGLSGAWRSMDACQPALAATRTARGDTPLSGRHYYLHQDRRQPEEFLTAVTVGSGDLDKTRLACTLFFVASCSSKVHFHAALVRRRKAAKSACRFLLTGQVCATSHATTFLRQVLLKKRDPATRDGIRKIVRALNGEANSGIVGVY